MGYLQYNYRGFEETKGTTQRKKFQNDMAIPITKDAANYSLTIKKSEEGEK